MHHDPSQPAGPLVVKLGGAAVDDPQVGAALWDALAALHRATQGGIVLVHGGGAAIDRRLAQRGMQSERRDGIRITPDEHIGEVVATLTGIINPAVVGQLQTRGVSAVGLTLADGGFAECVKTTRFAFDAGRVGEVIGGDPRLPRTLLRAGFMPVL
ncbi:MAG: amino acid kinase family protein, partial [Phycisphaerales bacterium]